MTLAPTRVAAWALAAVFAAPGCTAPSPADAPDLILHGGRIVTGHDPDATLQAIAVAGDRIRAVGDDDEVLPLAGAATQIIDLAGATVVPGLTDNHFHGIGGGPGVDLSRARSIADVVTRIQERASSTPPGTVIRTNSDWHEGQLREQRLPLRDDLDRATRDHPVVVVRGGHEYILNSAALSHWEIDPNTETPAGGRVGRYADGRLNGELVDRAKDLVRLPPDSIATDPRQEILDAVRTLNALGITSIRVPGGSVEQFGQFRELAEAGELDVRVDFLFRPRGIGSEDLAAAAEDWGVGPEFRENMLTVQGVKLGVDGGFEGGLMREPYEEPWGQGGTYFGLQTRPTQDFTAMVAWLNREGWRVATHAVGDAAMDLVLDAYEAADAERSIAGRRWTIEHGFIPALDHFERMRALGLTVTAQNHLYVAAPSLIHYWGPERAALTTPVGLYVAEEIPVSLGTDSPVIPYNPFWVLYHFTTRGTISAGEQGAEHAVDRPTALALMTAGYAYQVMDEESRGTLLPGSYADLAVLSEDYLTVPDSAIEDLRSVLTVVSGRIVFDARTR